MTKSILIGLTLTACDRDKSETEATSATWNGDVGPLITEHCAGCHYNADDAPGGFALDSYASASPIHTHIVDATSNHRMPP